jgi:hypothetical protein
MVVNGISVSVIAKSKARESQPHVMLDDFHNDFDKQNAESSLYCIPRRVRKGDDKSIYLLLLEVCDVERGVFRRVAAARGWGEDVKEKILARGKGEDKFPCEECRDGCHLIRIM